MVFAKNEQVVRGGMRMTFFVGMLAIAFGFVVGCIFVLPILCGVSLLSFVFGYVFTNTDNDDEDDPDYDRQDHFAVLFWETILAGNGVMWMMYYITAGQTWFGEFMHQYILR